MATIAEARPDLVERLVNPEDALRGVSSAKKVLVVCTNGHEPVEYLQTAVVFTRGSNGCPSCGPRKPVTTLEEANPDLISRIVNESDRTIPANSRKKIEVSCENGHELVVYFQTANGLVLDQNACPVCGKFGAGKTIEYSYPNLVSRLVFSEDKAVTAGSKQKITISCMNGHPRKEYKQDARAFTLGRNGCPVCGRSGSMKSIREVRPDLISRLVHEEDANIACKTNKPIRVRCVNGHDEVIYTQSARHLTSGNNGCPSCKIGGSIYSIESSNPEVVSLLVNEQDRKLSAKCNRMVKVQCDGSAYGLPTHKVQVYDQLVVSLTNGNIGCAVCSTGPSLVKKKVNFVLEGIIDHIENLSGAQKMALVLRRHGIKAGSVVGQAILKNDIDTLKDIMGDLSGGETDEEVLEDLVSGGDADDEFLVPDADVEDSDNVLPTVTTKDTFSALGALSEIAIGSDEDAVKFLVDSAVHRLWQMLYASEDVSSYIVEVRERLEDCANDYMCEFYGEFLRQYDEASGLVVPERWGFFEPNLMQKHMALLVGERKCVGNWSGTGSGKTASAILSAMNGEAKYVLVVCPNNTVKGWAETVKVCDPESEVVSKTFKPKWSEGDGAKWLVMNFDMFAGHEDAATNLMASVDFDMLVIDELHWTKERGGTQVSQRREILKKVRHDLKKDAMVLGMSATPVVNDLTEGKSLIALIEDKEPEFGTKLTLNNIQSLHENMIRVGFRAIIKPSVGFTEEEFPKIDISHLKDDLLEEGLSHVKIDAMVTMEYAETIAEIAQESKERGKGVMVYTEYLAGIGEPLTEYLRGEGLRVAHFTGAHEKADIGALVGNFDVLIGTQAIGTGVDGVQKWADTVVYATLPWTSAQFEQSRARVYRQGSTAETVRVVIPKGIVYLDDGKEWSWTEARWKRIQSKRDIASCAVDGEFPEHVVSSPTEATTAALAMLKRLDEETENDGE